MKRIISTAFILLIAISAYGEPYISIKNIDPATLYPIIQLEVSISHRSGESPADISEENIRLYEDAFRITGYSIFCAIFFASVTSGMISSLPGITGSFAFFISRLARFLSPMSLMTDAGGPINVTPELSQISGNRGFSAKNPYPGWIASALVISAALMMWGMLR